MNERHAVGNVVLRCPIAPKTHQLKKWSRSVAFMLTMTVLSLTMISPGLILAEDQVSSTDSSEGTGIQVASWLLTIPYCAGKSAFAIAGSVVGGLGYAFSGGNEETAKSVWTKSVYGTYILRPAHLRGEEPIHFLGQADENYSEPMKRAAATSNHANK